MILTEKELEHAWGGGPLREAAGLSSSETGRPPNYQTNGTCPPLSACAKHNPIVHYTGARDLESQPLEEERRSVLLFRFYSLTKIGFSLYLLSVTVWYLRDIVG